GPGEFAAGLRPPDVVHAAGRGAALAELAAAAAGACAAERPAAIAIAGHGLVARTVALAGNELGIPVVQTDAGVRSHHGADPHERGRGAAAHACSLWFAATAQQAVNLLREGFAGADVVTVGSLLAATLPPAERRRGRAVLLCTSNEPAG